MPSRRPAAASMPSRLAFSAFLAASSALAIAAVASSVAFSASSDFLRASSMCSFRLPTMLRKASASLPVSSLVLTPSSRSRLPAATSSANCWVAERGLTMPRVMQTDTTMPNTSTMPRMVETTLVEEERKVAAPVVNFCELLVVSCTIFMVSSYMVRY